mgnify:FL=1
MAPQYYYCPHCRHVISQWEIWADTDKDVYYCVVCGGLIDLEADAMGRIVTSTVRRVTHESDD